MLRPPRLNRTQWTPRCAVAVRAALGAGEAAHGPVTAAIANAVFDALGVRVRNLPITRDSLIAAMELTS